MTNQRHYLASRFEVSRITPGGAWRVVEKVGEYRGQPLTVEWQGLYATRKGAMAAVEKTINRGKGK